MVACQPLNLDLQAAVLMLRMKPKDRTFPLFNGASIPAIRSVNGTALRDLQVLYRGKLIVSCGLENRRLLIVHPCPSHRSLDDIRSRAENLQRNILQTLDIRTCLVCWSYMELCRCLSAEQKLTTLYQGLRAGEGVRAH